MFILGRGGGAEARGHVERVYPPLRVGSSRLDYQHPLLVFAHHPRLINRVIFRPITSTQQHLKTPSTAPSFPQQPALLSSPTPVLSAFTKRSLLPRPSGSSACTLTSSAAHTTLIAARSTPARTRLETQTNFLSRFFGLNTLNSLSKWHPTTETPPH